MKKIKHFHNWYGILPNNIQKEIKARFIKKTIKADGYLYQNGDPSTANYQIISGKIKICNFSHQGQEIIISYLYNGDWCGDIGVINGSERFNNAVAIEETKVNILKKEDFDYFYDKYPEVARAINQMLCTRLQSTLSILEDAFLLPLNFKLARTLSRLGFSIGESKNEGGSCIISPFSHEDLGRLVGATRQSVSRELKQLEKDGLIKLQYGKLIINNLQRFSDQFDDLMGHKPIVANYPTKQSGS
jgi:CRP-like cAMP-binding protein